jgi:hypothetical protein
MAGTSPIQLGSAVSGWTFEAATSISTSPSGIQSCMVSALWPDGSTILSNLPAAGASVSAIESTGYIPSSFLLDLTEDGPAIDYIEGRIARAKFKFKRQDPNRIGATLSRQVFADTVLNYDSQFNQQTFAVVGLGGITNVGLTGQNPNQFGFPEPKVTVKYNSTTEPDFTGTLANMYALPGSAKALNFPNVGDVTVPVTFAVGPGAVVTYYNGTTFISELVSVNSTYYFSNVYKSHPRGWQLINFKYDPVANRSFFDVEEQWRNYYFFFATTFIGKSP